ncbi:hypothetical protein B0H17DRAFT_1109797, partial [Mycena rosella]
TIHHVSLTPPPFPDFEFNFDPSLFPTPPPLPASADLFSQQYNSPRPPYSNPHLNTAPEPSTSGRPRRSTRSTSTRALPQHQQRREYSPRRDTPRPPPPAAVAAARTKPLLSTPQKRLNHIMSEQKRRNAIRDGYAQLIALLAPAGSAPGLGMPQRGRPKGSGSRGKGQSKVYPVARGGTRRDKGQVMRVEAAAGIAAR